MNQSRQLLIQAFLASFALAVSVVSLIGGIALGNYVNAAVAAIAVAAFGVLAISSIKECRAAQADNSKH